MCSGSGPVLPQGTCPPRPTAATSAFDGGLSPSSDLHMGLSSPHSPRPSQWVQQRGQNGPLPSAPPRGRPPRVWRSPVLGRRRAHPNTGWWPGAQDLISGLTLAAGAQSLFSSSPKGVLPSLPSIQVGGFCLVVRTSLTGPLRPFKWDKGRVKPGAVCSSPRPTWEQNWS